MSPASVRRGGRFPFAGSRQKGRLTIERIAGKDFATLAAINAMRAECHEAVRNRRFGLRFFS
jgi:hypothetical protein